MEDRLLDYPIMDRLQETLAVLTGLFNHFWLQTNVSKTVGITCQPFRTPMILL